MTYGGRLKAEISRNWFLHHKREPAIGPAKGPRKNSFTDWG